MTGIANRAPLLAVPLAYWRVGSDHARAAKLASPAGQADYLAFIQHQSFTESFFAFLAVGILFVLVIELLSYLLRGVWKVRAPQLRRGPFGRTDE